MQKEESENLEIRAFPEIKDALFRNELLERTKLTSLLLYQLNKQHLR
jgi:hypothetical protein